MSAKRGRGLVTGTGAVSPLGRSAAEFYTRLCAGENAIRELPPQDRRDMQATHAARYEGFSPQPEIPAMKARRLDRGSQFALIACRQAVAEAGYAIGDDPEAIGIAMGTGSAGAGALTEFLRVLILESPEAAPPFHFPNTVANAPASQVSIELKIYGPNVTITQKDPSALNALLFSTLALGSGRARAMLAGAVDEWNSFYAMGFDRVGALRGAKRESGIIQGEGAFVILLEDEEAVKRRGAAPLARLSGIATAGVASEPYRFAPDPRAMERAMRGALADAGTDARRDRPLAVLARRSPGDGRGRSRGGRGRLRRPASPRAFGQGRDRGDGRGRRSPARRGEPGDRRRAGAAGPRQLLRGRRQLSRRRDGIPPMKVQARSSEPLRGLTLDIPVRFAECDPYGVVWHGHYVLYFEHAREALTGRFGFTAARALEMGYRVPVTRMELRYRAPAKPDQLVRVTARLRSPSVARLVMDYEVRSESGELLVSGETEQVVINREGELLLTLPSGLRSLCTSILEFQDGLDATPPE